MKINLPLKGDPHAVLENVRSQIKNRDGEFEGNSTNGTFSIMGVHGAYEIIGQEAVVTVSKKPFFISEGFIRSEITKYFNNLA